MAIAKLPRKYPCELDISRGKCPHGLNARQNFRVGTRTLGGIGRYGLAQSTPGQTSARGRARVTLEAKGTVLAPGPSQPDILIWALQNSPPGGADAFVDRPARRNADPPPRRQGSPSDRSNRGGRRTTPARHSPAHGASPAIEWPSEKLDLKSDQRLDLTLGPGKSDG
jgi:hypothetical protein